MNELYFVVASYADYRVIVGDLEGYEERQDAQDVCNGLQFSPNREAGVIHYVVPERMMNKTDLMPN